MTTRQSASLAVDGEGQPGRIDMSPAALPERLEAALRGVSGRFAFVGVAGMLVAALATVADVLMRWLFASGVTALNEVISMAFVVAISACIVGGVGARIGVSVDVLANRLGPRASAHFAAIGSWCMFGFIALLAASMLSYAIELAGQNRTTILLGVLQAPFFFLSAALLGYAALVQAVIGVNDWRRARQVAGGSRLPATAVVLGLACLGLLAGLAWIALNLDTASGWVQDHLLGAGALALLIMWLLLLAMQPLAVVLGAIGLLGAALVIGFEPSFKAFGSEAARFLTDYNLATLPLFLMMGSFATVAGISDDIFRVSQALFGRMRGGLAMATIGGCAGFGAVTGSSFSTVAIFGRLAMPQMKSRQYAPEFAIGCVAAGGTLGALIPPSGVLILYAMLTETSIGKLFAAAVLPALVAIVLYVLTISVVVRLVPSYAPPPTRPARGELLRALANSAAFVLLFSVVMGGLFSGVFTATESAAVGAVGAMLIALMRRKLSRGKFWTAMAETTHSTALIYMLVFGVVMFSFSMAITDLPAMLSAFMGELALPPLAVILVIVLCLLLVGCFMDSMSILLITTPILVPVILELGYDLIWWGVVSLVVVELGLITPPFGMHVFILKSMDPSISLSRAFVGVLPFCVADLLKLLMLLAVPALALWLPAVMG